MTEGSAEGAAWQSTSGGLAFHMRRLIEPPEGAVLLPILQIRNWGFLRRIGLLGVRSGLKSCILSTTPRDHPMLPRTQKKC